jgi:hypothetical protein
MVTKCRELTVKDAGHVFALAKYINDVGHLG